MSPKHRRPRALPVSIRLLSAAVVAVAAAFPVSADEAQWIWVDSPEIRADGDMNVAEGDRGFFRKNVNLRVESTGRIEIAADDDYEVFVNGVSVGTGSSHREMMTFDLSDQLDVGRNVIAVRVDNTQGTTAALAARVTVEPVGTEDYFHFHTDASWKSTGEGIPTWQSPVFNDRLWGTSVTLGKLGETSPWDRGEDVPVADDVEQRERFQIQRGFGIQRLMDDEEVGSLIAMEFNEFGHILASVEGGPLLLLHDRDDDDIVDSVRTYCDQVTSCQGILPLNGEVFVTGMGPEGHALYRLSDRDRNGSLESVRTILKFDGPIGEHGAHGLALGPDGMIYVSVGSHVRAVGEGGPGETMPAPYEGDVLPRYEDPAGHGRNIKAPGGTIVRTDIEGKTVERIAGGVRNAYDLTFHPDGSLFIHDADMEADVELAWYRPTAVMDVTEGAEFGWRPGWSKWPEYYLDRLPNVIDTGRGSPTGAACYEHYMFPVRYQNSLFLADWSEGRILNVRLKKEGSGHVAESHTFLQGQPLNVTDVTVGPDGALYFCTGGRGTDGGVYRVVYKGEIPDQMKELGTGVARAVRQPQATAAYSRQEIAAIKSELGTQWGQLIAGVAYSNDNPPHYRTRAMDLMQLFGPVPSDELLGELAAAGAPAVRARAAKLMGLHPSVENRAALEVLLTDGDARVRRDAMEAILRSRQYPETADALLDQINGDDRRLRYLAVRVLEQMPTGLYRNEVFQADNARMKNHGLLALLGADPTPATCRTVLRHAGLMLDGYLSDDDFIDTLRLCEVAISRGNVKPDELVRLREQLTQEFPAGDGRMNQELIRLIATLGADDLADRALEYIEGDAPMSERVLVAMCLQFVAEDWTPRQRFRLLKFYENAAVRPTEGSMSMYVVAATRDFAASLSPDDVSAIIDQGAVWRNAALASMYRLPRPADAETAKRLRNLDRQLLADPKPGDVERRLRTGIIAMLATAEDDESAEYLRRIWRTEPRRRGPVAMALAQRPEGDNWDYLVRSLNILEEGTSEAVIRALLTVPVATDDPTALRQLILLGARNEQMDLPFETIEQLLEHWTGLQRPEGGSVSMAPWQKWFAKTYPDRPAAELPDAQQSRWDFEELVAYLDSDEGRTGDVDAGRLVYETASCASCHQFGDLGDSVGPPLTNLSRRFAKREIVESILYPAHVISDQYASKKVLTNDGRVSIGVVSDRGATIEVRDANNHVTEIDKSDIDQIRPSTASIMPSGLLDDLTLRQISDLMAFLGVAEPARLADGRIDAPERGVDVRR